MANLATITNNILADSGIDSISVVTGSGTANQIAYWSSGTTVASLSTATYPSLTELSYVKGVTSAIQTQINGKLDAISDSEQEIPGRYYRFNAGSGLIRMDPRWNESGYDADLGVLHIYSTTAAGANYGRTGLALYNDAAYVYLTTKTGDSNLYVNNNKVWTAGNDGTGSGLDADLLDGNHASAFQLALTLTTTGSSGASTLVGATLNIPTYTLSGLGGVPTSRTLTINGVAQDLSADRSWTIAAGVSSVAGTANQVLVNGGTAAATGAVTLSLPQSIATSSSPTFDRITTSGLYGNSGSGNIPIWQYDANNPGYGIMFYESSPDYLKIDVSGNLVTGTPDFQVSPDTAYVNGNIVLHAGNYNSYAPTLTGGGASGTWNINVNGSSGSTGTLLLTGLGNGSVNVNNPNTAVYRTETGSGAVLAYAPVLHIGGGDTMWQAQGTYGTSGNGTLYFRQGYNGSWGTWLTMLSSANYGSYALPLSGGTLTGPVSLNNSSYFVGSSSFGFRFNNAADTANNMTLTNANADLYVRGQVYVGGNGSNTGTQLVYNSGTWGINITGSAQLLDDVNNYTWSSSTTPTSYSLGMQLSFVGPNAGEGSWQNYGTVINARTYAGGGGSLQIYVPYGPNNGGPALQVRFGDYSAPTYGNQWTAWKTLLQSDNYNSYAPTLTGGGASGTWGINITGSAGSASSVAWSNISGGTRNNYTLGFSAPSSGYAGFEFFGTNGNSAGYFLIRGTSDNDVYTAEGITLVADQGWVTIAQRSTANKGVRIMTGTTSTLRISVTDSFSDIYNIVSSRSGSTSVDNVRFYNQDGNYAYIRTTSAGNNNNPWYDGTLGSTMWYAWDNPGQSRTAGVYTEHRFGNGRGNLSEYVKVNRGRLYTHNSSDVATITLDGLTGRQSFSSSNGTIISNASVSDMIGYNSTYQTYISGTATTLYATGIYYDGSGYRTLLHSANYNTYAVARYQTTQTGPNPVKIWNGHLASFSTNSSGNTYTIIQTSVPQDNYQMGGFTIEFFNNYDSTNGKTQIDLGGYWNPEANGGFIGFEYHTSNPFVTPNIQIARNSSTGNVAFIITNSGQSYQVVVARDLWLGYNASESSSWGTGWTIYETSSISGFTNNDGVVARVAAGSDGTNASGTWGINVTGTAASETLNTVASRGATSNYPITISSTAGNTLRIIGASSGSAQIYATGANYGIRIDGASNSSAYYLANLNSPSGDVLFVRADGVVGVNTSDFAYTANDNTPLVGSTTNNKLFVSGSIQLLGNNDAIVFGRSTATFLKDEEIGFGWGGGWYMTDGTYLRVRNNKTIYTTGDYEGKNVYMKSNGSLEIYVSDNTSFCHMDARANGNYATLHKYTYNPSLNNYGQYRENWWDGDSYHSIYVSGNQWYFDSSVNAPSFFETSDSRLKTLIEDNHIPVGIESIVAKLYEKDGKTEIGYFAQDVEKIMSHAISKSEEGFLNLSYREVHTAKIAYLEQKVIYLENQLKQIKNENN